MQYRQGDVLLEAIAALPDDVQPLARENGAIILAHGEATGHAHKIKNRVAKFFANAQGRYLSLARPAALTHDEHDPITLPAGHYRVTRQREYSPEEIRHVTD